MAGDRKDRAGWSRIGQDPGEEWVENQRQFHRCGGGECIDIDASL